MCLKQPPLVRTHKRRILFLLQGQGEYSGWSCYWIPENVAVSRPDLSPETKSGLDYSWILVCSKGCKIKTPDFHLFCLYLGLCGSDLRILIISADCKGQGMDKKQQLTNNLNFQMLNLKMQKACGILSEVIFLFNYQSNVRFKQKIIFLSKVGSWI